MKQLYLFVRIAWGFGWLIAWPGTATAQAPVERPAFEVNVIAPEPLRALLLRHLPLLRYRELSDIDETELSRLLILAERDTREIAATQGFFNPRIALRQEASTAGMAGAPPRVTLTLDPGEPTRVREAQLEFAGDIASADAPAVVQQREAIRRSWPLGPGAAFTQDAWDNAKAQALRQLQARRYLRGDIARSEADVDAATGQARLGLKLDSGPAFKLGPLQITGMQRYDPRLVPRLARLPEGTEYDQDRLEQARLRLAGSGYFDSVFLLVDPASDPAAAPMQLSLREAPLQRVQLGVGLTTDNGPRLSVEHRHNRVPGIGWRADTRLQLQRDNPFIESEWTAIPDASGWRTGVLGRIERLEDSGGQVTRSQRMRVGRSRAEDRVDRNYTLQFDRSDVSDATGALAPQDRGDGTSLAFNYVWTGRYFDRQPTPTSGYALGFELGGGLTLTGSKSPFQRTVARGLWLQPLAPGRGRMQYRAEAGAVLARGSARLPSTQLFRTGGDTTVRGYGYRDIGVERMAGVIGPGRYLASGSAEWQRPLQPIRGIAGLEQTLFIDAGAVADRPGHLFKPRVGVGTGIRVATPIGPLQADIAYGMHTRRLQLHLNVGVTF